MQNIDIFGIDLYCSSLSIVNFSQKLSFQLMKEDFKERFIINPGTGGLVSLIENLRVLLDWLYAQARVCWKILRPKYDACAEKFSLHGNGDSYLYCDRIF
jgi:hypothetical protein